MQASVETPNAVKAVADLRPGSPTASAIRIGLLTGCQDRPYAFGLAMALARKGVNVDIVGGDEIDSPEFHSVPGIRFLNFRGNQNPREGLSSKLMKLLRYYTRLARYAANGSPRTFHILWNNKFEYFDRTLLLVYYKLFGHKIVQTAHNVNQDKRDGCDSFLNRFTLRIQYKLADNIFVHTDKMKAELLEDFGVSPGRVTVIRHPINDAFPETALTPAEAKTRLGIAEPEKTILFFGRLRPYKGLEYLISAFRELLAKDPTYRLIIAGEPKKGSEQYEKEIEQAIAAPDISARIIARLQFIPDEDTELYLKAADVLLLPYKDIFQSGVLFLAYSFGLPVVASDVGSFREIIIEGTTGFLAPSCEPADLASAISKFFASELYRNLNSRRREIREFAHANYSWDAVAELTRNVYSQLSEGKST